MHNATFTCVRITIALAGEASYSFHRRRRVRDDQPRHQPFGKPRLSETSSPGFANHRDSQ